MNAALLLQWHYLIFLVPFGLSSFLLLLSSLQLGNQHGGHAGHGHVHGIGGESSHAIVHAPAAHSGPPAAHGGAPHAAAVSHHHASAHQGDDSSGGSDGESADTHHNLLLGMLGAGKAPLPLVLEVFFIFWGLCGILANQWLLSNTPLPTLAQMLPSLGIAFGGGLVGGRLSAELLGRILPREESFVVSRDGLYGLKGKVTFPVSAEAGRILVYDSHGTLHDETCRIASEQPAIPRGRSVIVMDRDAKGHLIVEELFEE